MWRIKNNKQRKKKKQQKQKPGGEKSGKIVSKLNKRKENIFVKNKINKSILYFGDFFFLI